MRRFALLSRSKKEVGQVSGIVSAWGLNMVTGFAGAACIRHVKWVNQKKKKITA